jgi:hypothetical protein
LHIFGVCGGVKTPKRHFYLTFHRVKDGATLKWWGETLASPDFFHEMPVKLPRQGEGEIMGIKFPFSL